MDDNIYDKVPRRKVDLVGFCDSFHSSLIFREIIQSLRRCSPHSFTSQSIELFYGNRWSKSLSWQINFYSHLKSTLLSLLVGYVLLNAEKLYLSKCKIFREGLYALHVRGHRLTILLVGGTHLYFQQEQSFSVRTRGCSLYDTFSIQSFYFIFDKNKYEL
jgi:hypothetical protein